MNLAACEEHIGKLAHRVGAVQGASRPACRPDDETGRAFVRRVGRAARPRRSPTHGGPRRPIRRGNRRHQGRRRSRTSEPRGPTFPSTPASTRSPVAAPGPIQPSLFRQARGRNKRLTLRRRGWASRPSRMRHRGPTAGRRTARVDSSAAAGVGALSLSAPTSGFVRSSGRFGERCLLHERCVCRDQAAVDQYDAAKAAARRGRPSRASRLASCRSGLLRISSRPSDVHGRAGGPPRRQSHVTPAGVGLSHGVKSLLVKVCAAHGPGARVEAGASSSSMTGARSVESADAQQGMAQRGRRPSKNVGRRGRGPTGRGQAGRGPAERHRGKRQGPPRTQAPDPLDAGHAAEAGEAGGRTRRTDSPMPRAR